MAVTCACLNKPEKELVIMDLIIRPDEIGEIRLLRLPINFTEYVFI